MVAGYLRRQRMLSQLRAVAIGELLSGATGADISTPGDNRAITGTSGKRYTKVSSDVLLLRATSP